MSIKNLLGRKVAKITGRECRRCIHNVDGYCTASGDTYMKCWHSLTRPGFKERPGKYLRQATELTPQQQHELDKIKQALQEAGETARESGLLED